jgi:hypothetical protein
MFQGCVNASFCISSHYSVKKHTHKNTQTHTHTPRPKRRSILCPTGWMFGWRTPRSKETTARPHSGSRAGSSGSALQRRADPRDEVRRWAAAPSYCPPVEVRARSGPHGLLQIAPPLLANPAHLLTDHAHRLADHAHLVADHAHLLADHAHPLADHAHLWVTDQNKATAF